MTTQRIPFRKGKLVTLCLPLRSDMEQITRWINDPTITQYLQAHRPLSLECEYEWYDRLTRNDTDNVVFFLETNEDKRLIGTMGLHGINHRIQVAGTGAMIGDASAHGKGYGTDAKMQLLHWAFTELNLRKVTSNVYASNPRSQRYLAKSGYRIVGTRKAHNLVHGQFVDEHILEVFKEDFMPLWDAYTRS